MKITCISDLHGYKPKLEGGDLLIVAGDFTSRDEQYQYIEFFIWLSMQKYEKKILVSGNHDGEIQKRLVNFDPNFGLIYLQDSSCEFDGLKIWGSPWTSTFEGINPHCKAFTVNHECDAEYWLNDHWNLIPSDTDILITHGPAFGILDKTCRGEYVGSSSLRDAVDRVKPKLYVFGHIHECGGQSMVIKHPGYGDENNTFCINASVMDERYRPINKIMNIEI